MVYTVPESKKSLKQNRFEFSIDGARFELPKFKFLPIEKIEALDASETSGQFSTMLALFGQPDTAIGKALRTLDIEQFTDLFSAWQKDSGVTVGESEASANS